MATSYEFECTKKCKSVVHGRKITAACTKRSVPDLVLIRFMAKFCKNFGVTDNEGRSALHLVASINNRTGIVEFLLKNGANANLKDLESGQTPLHRSIFFGCLKSAVVLMRYNASLDIHDVESLSPLHYCLPPKRKPKKHGTEIFAYGSNSHYNLGLDQGQGTVPKCVDFFKRNGISVTSIAMSSFHSLFLSSNNELYAVGHGFGGRLGHGSESTAVQPQRLNLRFKRTDEKIISLSASKNHSLILTNLGNVYACGSNTYGQLGVRENHAKLLQFQNINCNEFQNLSLIRIIALEHHSIAYSNSEIFAWGQNTGQLGLRTSNDVIRVPQSVPLNGQQIILLDACNSGLVFYSGNKYLNVFINFKMKFFKTPGLEIVNHLTIGDADQVVKVLVMTESYQLYIWDDSNPKYTKCFFEMFRQLNVQKMFWSGSRIAFLAEEDIYISTAINKVAYNESDDDVSEYQEIYSTKKDICQTNRIRINLKRVCYGSSVKDIWSDYEGLNYLFIRDDPLIHLTVPMIHDQNITLDVLYEEMNEFDGIHDVLFHVGREILPAHKYVVLSRAPDTFTKWIESAKDGKNVFIDDMSPVEFGLVLKIIYSNHFLTEEDVKQLKVYYKASEEMEALLTFTKVMKKFNLGQFLAKDKKNLLKFQLDRNSFPELHDVTIQCANYRKVMAHKCVLVGRLQYFNMMFNNSWIESSEVNFSTVPVEYVDILLDFLYDNSASRLLSKKYSESFVTNMIVLSDQLFIERLKDIFQVHILKRFTTMKRCPELLELAYTYNCELLKKSILDFICANLKDVLENRVLENIHLDYLSDLDDRYKEMFPEIKYRQVVPSSQIDEEYIDSFAKNFTADMSVTAATVPKVSRKPSKEIKNTSKTRVDYEKEGKLILLRNDDTPKHEDISPVKFGKNLASILSQESSQVLNEIQEQNKAIWVKVDDKKQEPKRKSAVISALNANEVLRNEEKLTENFSNLKLVLRSGGDMRSPVDRLPIQDDEIMVEHSPSQINTRISFGDFFSPPSASYSSGGGGRERMSQKQRKRQSSRISESDIETNSTSSPNINREAVPAFESVWNIPKDNRHNNAADLGAFKKNLSKDDRTSSSVVKKGTVRAINFDAILMDEKEERQYFMKLATKALTLTQLEESAMSELHAFYNVDQVFDETIQIERKVRQQVSQNFSHWARPSDASSSASH